MVHNDITQGVEVVFDMTGRRSVAVSNPAYPLIFILLLNTYLFNGRLA
jgi:hypothetical protein